VAAKRGGDDVGEAVVAADLDLDIRVLGQPWMQPRPDQHARRMFRGGDAHHAGGLAAQFAQRRQLRIDVGKARSHRPIQAFPRGGRRHAAGGAVQQLEVEAPLERADTLAQRRLRHAQLRGRPGEAALAHHSGEDGQIVEMRH